MILVSGVLHRDSLILQIIPPFRLLLNFDYTPYYSAPSTLSLLCVTHSRSVSEFPSLIFPLPLPSTL